MTPMLEIVPAILAHTEEEFTAKVERVRPLCPMVHVDIMDGIFVANNTWAPVEKVADICGDLEFSVHLMVSNPEHLAPVWAVSGAKRVFFHIEATTKEELIMRAIEENGDGDNVIGVAINPETPISRIVPILPKLSHVLVMGVRPGWSGQEFQSIALDKVSELLRLKPGLTIGMDGGVKPRNVADIAKAGASTVAIGSALTDAADPSAAYEDFKNALT